MRQTDESVYLAEGVLFDFAEAVAFSDEVVNGGGEELFVGVEVRFLVAACGSRLMDATTVNNDSRSFFMSGTD
jgi:hypothetical protein